jgi:hypothetical protein
MERQQSKNPNQSVMPALEFVRELAFGRRKLCTVDKEPYAIRENRSRLVINLSGKGRMPKCTNFYLIRVARQGQSHQAPRASGLFPDCSFRGSFLCLCAWTHIDDVSRQLELEGKYGNFEDRVAVDGDDVWGPSSRSSIGDNYKGLFSKMPG